MKFVTLGRYKILDTLKQSAAGTLFLALDPETDREVTLQTLEFLAALPRDQQAEAREHLLRDVDAARTLSHPGIVPVLDLEESEGLPFLVTEHVAARSLEAWCERPNLLSNGIALELIARVAEVLDYAHAHSVIHADVRPANLLRTQESEVRIAGFGLARARQIGSAHPAGPPNYLSPEIVRGAEPDGRSDLFSLGAVLYELLTGRPAFPGDSAPSVLFRIVNEEPPAPSREDVPPELYGVLRRALAKIPGERYANGGEMAEALRSASVGLTVDSVTDLGQRPARAAARRSTDLPATGPDPLSAAAPPIRVLPARSSARPFVLAVVLLAVASAIALLWWRDPARGGSPVVPEPPVWETRVSTEPAGLEVRLDGIPLDPAAQGLVRYRGVEPFGVLSVEQGCRADEHRLGPADAFGNIVLVLDPSEVEVAVAPAVPGASVKLNGKNVGATPASLRLDLCRENRLEILADGYRPASITTETGARPLEVRKLVYALELERIPKGILTLPREKGMELLVYVDDQRVDASETRLELENGKHRLRVKSDFHWLDATQEVEVVAGQTVTPGIDLRLATLKVQAYPPNCKVYLRRPRGQWKYLDDTPAERRVAIGPMQIKIELIPTGETQVKDVQLVEGANAPIRVSFGGAR